MLKCIIPGLHVNTCKPVIRKRDGVWTIYIQPNTFCGGLEYIAALNLVNKLNKELK